jgi:hypothetical protein
MTAADLPGTREALARELRTHPGARALIESLEEVLSEFDASTGNLDLQAQHFDGEWKHAADLTRKLIALLSPDPALHAGYAEATDSTDHDRVVCDCYACVNWRDAEASHEVSP